MRAVALPLPDTVAVMPFARNLSLAYDPHPVLLAGRALRGAKCRW
jgi:hypothetical protein